MEANNKKFEFQSKGSETPGTRPISIKVSRNTEVEGLEIIKFRDWPKANSETNELNRQRALIEELLAEKKENLDRLEKDREQKKESCLMEFEYRAWRCNRDRCDSCGGVHCQAKNYQTNLKVALECKKHLLEGNYSELAGKLFEEANKNLSGISSVKELFDFEEKIYQKKESIKSLEESLIKLELQKQKSEQEIETVNTPTTEIEDYFAAEILE